jgi:hypothetical protein
LILSLAGVSIILDYGPPEWIVNLSYQLPRLTSRVLIVLAAWLAVMAAGGEVIYGQLGRLNYHPIFVLGRYSHTVDPKATVFLVSGNELHYGTHSSVDVLSGNRPVTNWTALLDQIKVNTSTILLAGPTRSDEPRGWANAQTNGHLVQQFDCAQPMLLAYQPAQLP